jgi:hypothetical protein
VCSPEIDFAIVAFPLILSQISVEIHRQRSARKGKSLKICPVGLMTPWIYDEKFPVGTQFLFGTLMFTTGEDENIELEVRGPQTHQWVRHLRWAPYSPTGPSSTTTLASDGV